MKNIVVVLFLMFPSLVIHSQNEAEVLPEGIVFPRMTTTQRDALTPKSGQCVFNFDTNCIECFDGGGNWRSYRFNRLYDSDNDTYITTEFVSDEDIIRMDIKGQQALWIRENDNGQLYFEPRSQGNNTFFGTASGLAFDNTATDNTVFGSASGFNLTTGDHNTAFGVAALALIENGSFNLGIGSRSLENSINTNRNIAMGYQSLQNADNNDNIAIGHQTMKALGDGSENIAIGNYALTSATAFTTGSIAIGHEALRMHPNSSDNIAIGYRAGKELGTNSQNNLIIGRNALRQSTIASSNIVIGTGMELSTVSPFTFTGPINNIAIGFASMEGTEGRNSVAVGSNALNGFEEGTGNTAIGVEAMIALSTGSRNTAVGFGALFSTQGSRNTGVGNSAGQSNQGSLNVFIGNEAGAFTAGDNQLHIANTSSKSLISGDFSTDEVTINNIVNLTPRNTPPPTPSTGTIYMDDGTNTGGVPTLRVYINSTVGWKDL